MSLLSVLDLRVSFGVTTILRSVSIEVPEGSVVGLVGRNGAGKTTTLRAIMGLIPSQAKTIVCDGVDLQRQAAHLRTRLGIGYAPEDSRLVPGLTVDANLRLPLLAADRRDGAERLAQTYEAIPIVGELRNRRANELSGGQQKVVAVARAMVIGSRLLLLDEPFEGLAPALASEVAAAIAAARAAGVSTLVAESEPRHLVRLATSVVGIERGVSQDVPDWASLVEAEGALSRSG